MMLSFGYKRLLLFFFAVETIITGNGYLTLGSCNYRFPVAEDTAAAKLMRSNRCSKCLTPGLDRQCRWHLESVKLTLLFSFSVLPQIQKRLRTGSQKAPVTSDTMTGSTTPPAIPCPLLPTHHLLLQLPDHPPAGEKKSGTLFENARAV